MDRNRIVNQVFGILILSLSYIKRVETTELYCTKEDSWTKAMSTCLDIDGKPMSYREIADAADVKLKQRITVWASDYIYWNTVESMSQLTEDYECGYMRFSRRLISGFWYYGKNEYTSTTGVEYDACTNKKLYICENETSKDTYEYGPGTWLQAYQSCRSPNKLWSGYLFTGPYIETPEFWVKSAKTFIRDTLTAVQNLSTHLAECGTSEGPLEREGRNNCDQRFKAVCILENKTDDTRLSQSCLQEAPTTKPITTLSTRKMTHKPTRPKTQPKTTVESSLQSTDTFNGTSPQSTPEAPTTKPTTALSTRKMTLKTTRPTTQPKTTVESSLQSTDTFNGTSSLSTPDGLTKTTVIVITTAAVVVTISCTVTVSVLLFFCRNGHRSKNADPCVVQFTDDSPARARVFQSRNDKTSERVCENNEAEVEAYYEVVPDNIQQVYVNEIVEGRYEALDLVNNQQAVYLNKTPEGFYEKLKNDNAESV